MELAGILERNDFTTKLNYSGTFGRSPSRTKINDLVAEWSNGAILDGKLPRTVRFIAKDQDDKWFLFIYYEDDDIYLYEKLTARS